MIRQQQLPVELVVKQSHAQKAQAVAGLNAVGLPIPSAALLRQVTPVPIPAGAPRPYSAGGKATLGQTPRCPLCSGVKWFCELREEDGELVASSTDARVILDAKGQGRTRRSPANAALL
jgi:hypothetical protein